MSFLETSEGLAVPEEPTSRPVGMSIPQAAIEYGISESTLYALANRMALPGARRLGRRIVVHRPTFEKWLCEGMGQ